MLISIVNDDDDDDGAYVLLRFKEKRWDSKRMLDSGGMPSSHSATVTALAVAIALQQGTGGPAFALAVVLACVVCPNLSLYLVSLFVLFCYLKLFKITLLFLFLFSCVVCKEILQLKYTFS